MTQVIAPGGLDPHWQTRLFAAAPAQTAAEPSRLSPRAAYQELLYGRAVLMDIRPDAERSAHGEIHPAVCGDSAVAAATAAGDTPHDAVIVLCQEGQASLVAAESLRRSGRARVTDVIGGFRAWRDLGLPTA